MLVPNRNYSSPNYRYGFNGKEKDDEIKGSNNSLDFGARIYDPRAVRFGSIDPAYKKFPWYSPYLFAGNTPIMAGDANGLYPIVRGGKIVGYVIEPGQGPTQIAKDINNPDTQAIYGYCLQKPVTWDKVVTDNITYYAKAGNWEENTNIMSKDNLIYRDLNSNAGDELQLRFDEEPDAVSSVLNLNKNIQNKENILVKNDIYLNIWGAEGSSGEGEGWATERAKGNEKIHYMNWDDVGGISRGYGPGKARGLTRNMNPEKVNYFIKSIKVWMKNINLVNGKKDVKSEEKKVVEEKVTIRVVDYKSKYRTVEITRLGHEIGSFGYKDTTVNKKDAHKESIRSIERNYEMHNKRLDSLYP